ncbi:hypothetical protein [Nonomuraea sp. NPDC049129]|uniref:hypothetical protein n=1 Tax=Nonomuraea sp. NPDC049129 TaxID=3155272 RepID=UPI0033D5E24F
MRASSSISREAIGTNGSIPDSSSRSSLASAGMSSADSGGMTSRPASSSRTAPTSFGEALASVSSRSSGAWWSSSLTCSIASAA